MQEDKDVSIPPTTLGSTRGVAQLRPVRLPSSAYPSSPTAPGAPTRAQQSMLQTLLHAADTGTDGTAAACTPIANNSRITKARVLHQRLTTLYWEEDKHVIKYNTYGAAGGPKGEGADVRRETASQLMEGFCVYNKRSSVNEGRDDLSRAQAEEEWNTTAERFLTAQTQDLELKKPASE